MPTFSEHMHRRAVIVIPAEQLVRLFDMPPGLVCTGIHADPIRRSLTLEVVDVEGGTLEPVPPGDVAPDFPPSGWWQREQYSVAQDDGTSKVYVRFGWEPEEPATVGGLVEGLRKTGASPDVLAAALESEARQRKHPIVPLGSDTVAPHEY